MTKTSKKSLLTLLILGDEKNSFNPGIQFLKVNLIYFEVSPGASANT
jgi:hypothetical protein